MEKPTRLTYLGLFIVCGCVLISEILLTRIFSVCIWYHFAFFVISIAMFGLGLGSLFVQLCPGFFVREKLFKHLFFASLLLAFTSLVAPLFLFKINLPNDILNNFGNKTFIFLARIFLLSSLPFFFGGLVTSLLFKTYPKDISRLYFADLTGASLGCLLIIPLLERFGAGTTLLLNSTLISFAALLFSFNRDNESSRFSWIKTVSVFIFSLFVIFSVLNTRFSLFDLKYAKGQDRSGDEFSKWNSISRIAVRSHLKPLFVRSVAERIWGVSQKVATDYPAIKILNIDCDAGTFLTHFQNDFDAVGYVRLDPPSIVHRLKHEPLTLVIGAGGGKDVLAALSFGARHVTAVELNPIIVKDVMLGKYCDFTGRLYQNPKVTAVADEGRSFISSRREKYDIIQLSYVDTSAATSGGAYALAENNLYTTESFAEYIQHLRPDGIFSVCWVNTDGLDGGARLVSLGIAALEKIGIKDVARHMMVVTHMARRGWDIHNVLLKREPFTDEEQAIVLATCEELGFNPLFIPRNDYRATDYTLVKEYGDVVKCLINNPSQRELIYAGWPLNIRPTTDDNPFFFYQKLPKDLLKKQAYIVYSSATVVLQKVLYIGLIMVGFFYLIPLLVSLKYQKIMPYRGKQIFPFLAFFSSIGIGFMLLEIVFMQKLLLFLGHPIYSLSVTLLSMLFFAGVGSLFTQELKKFPPQRYISGVLLILLLVIMLYIVFSPMIFKYFMGYPKTVKILVAVLTLFFPSFFMGMPLPLAIKILDQRFSQVIPWMWGVNAATSVLASIMAIILAMNIGYNFTFFVGAVFYALALNFASMGFSETS